MKIAAVDLGSNSLHMLIAEANRSGSFRVLASEKDMVRLGARTLSRGRLPEAAMRRAVEVLRDYRRLADTHGVDTITAVATSAIREARNGEDLLERIGREVGIYPKAISGEDEARYVYLAALHSVRLEGKRALVLDVGGGSVEMALGLGARLEQAYSEKLGVLRMTERFVASDPIAARDERRLVRYVEGIVAPHVARIREAGFDVAVGTSGTILSIGALAHEAETGRRAETLHHLKVGADSIRAVRRRLTSLPLRERLRIHGLDPARADIIAAGAIVLDTLLRRLGVRELILSEWALREGILLHYIHGHPRSLARAEAYPDVRRRSVVELAERCLVDAAHSRHVTTLALALFDATRPLHRLADEARARLEHAATLHDVGHHISHPRHHRHSYYLIKNGDLRGFDPVEVEIMANVARYHRQAPPRKKHPPFADLPRAARREVEILSGLLRLADGLDRGHRQRVRSITVARRGTSLRVACEAPANIELEIWGARRRLALLEKALGATVRVEAVRAAARARRARGG